MEQNFIQYKTGELYRTIRPPVVSTIDMETINKPVSNDPRTSHLHPQGATKEQLPLSFSIKHGNTYNHFPLPTELQSPRTYHHNHDDTDESHFFIQLLLVLYKDTFLLHKYLIDCLTGDTGPTPYNEMTHEEIDNHFSANFCAICGYKFNTTRKMPSGRMTTVTRTRHHCHLTRSKQRMIPVCSVCNLHMPTAVHSKVGTRKRLRYCL